MTHFENIFSLSSKLSGEWRFSWNHKKSFFQKIIFGKKLLQNFDDFLWKKCSILENFILPIVQKMFQNRTIFSIQNLQNFVRVFSENYFLNKWFLWYLENLHFPHITHESDKLFRSASFFWGGLVKKTFLEIYRETNLLIGKTDLWKCSLLMGHLLHVKEEVFVLNVEIF